MERDDWENLLACAACGASVAPGSERGFAFGVGNVLCWSCSMERGGRYDAERDVWDVAPDIGGLPDEAYGSAPREFPKERG